VSSVAGRTSGSRSGCATGRDGRTVGAQLVASRARRREPSTVPRSDLGSAAITRCARSADVRGREQHLDAAVGRGRGRRARARGEHERLRGVRDSATGTRAVSRTTKRPTSICVRRATVGSSTVRRTRCADRDLADASLIVFEPSTNSSAVVAELLGLDHRPRNRHVRLGQELGGAPRGRPPDPFDAGLNAGSTAHRRPVLQRLGPTASVSGKLPPGPAASRSVEAPRAASGEPVLVQAPPATRWATLDLPDPRDRSGWNAFAASASMTTIHVTNVGAPPGCPRCRPRPGTRRASRRRFAARRSSR